PPTIRRALEQRAFPAALALTTYDGQVLGIPTENQIDALLWNKQIFAEAGIGSPPTTWSELAAIAPRLTRRNAEGQIERIGFVVESWDWAVQYLAMLASEGGAYIDGEGRVAFNDSLGLEVLERLVEWSADLGFFSTNRGLFNDRRAAMGVMFPWARFNLVNTFEDPVSAGVGVGPVPTGAVGRAAYHYGWGLYVPADGPQTDEAWRFVEFLTLFREERPITYLGQALAGIGSLPTLRDDIQSPAYRGDQAFYAGFVANFPFAYSEPKLPEGQRRMGILTQELNAALNRTKSPVQALSDAATQIEAILQAY
ncbi:MAG TPA: extracellular solute-binding protein, partial [Limnochordia bacterium]